MADKIRTITADVDGSVGSRRISISVVLPKGKENDQDYLSKVLENEYDKKFGATAQLPKSQGSLTPEIPGVKPPLDIASKRSSTLDSTVKNQGFLESAMGVPKAAWEGIKNAFSGGPTPEDQGFKTLGQR